MKNIKLNASRKSGFSLVEMLVVIAIIGIIAAIAIPNIGNINDSAKQAASKRNAQSIASVVNAAVAAGAVPTSTTVAGIITEVTSDTGLVPAAGPFAGKRFGIGTMEAQDKTDAAGYLTWDNTNKQLKYAGSSGTTAPAP